MFMSHILTRSRDIEKIISQLGSIFNLKGGFHMKKFDGRILSLYDTKFILSWHKYWPKMYLPKIKSYEFV